MQRLIQQIILLGLVLCALNTTLSASVAIAIIHTETTVPNPAVYHDIFGPSSTISVSGGDATFTGELQNNTLVSVTGGYATFTGDIFNGAVFTLTGGVTTIDTLKNNATLNVSQSAELVLTYSVGNNGTVELESGGTLILEGDDIFSANSHLEANGGTIETNGHDLSFDSVNVSGTETTTIDLGGGTGIVDLGEVDTSDGQIIEFTNWTPETVVYYDPASSIDPSTQIVFEGVGTQAGGDSASPIPEPAQTAIALLFATALASVLKHKERRATVIN